MLGPALFACMLGNRNKVKKDITKSQHLNMQRKSAKQSTVKTQTFIKVISDQ